jgi:4-amino-4-deoxy-L-arabinose transferase-like glycosyltransferase
MPSALTYRRILTLIVIAFAILAIIYALATPPLEASDEYKHYPVVHHVQTKGTMPILDSDDPGLWLQEAAQPPLYYLIMAAITSWINTDDLTDLHQVNPHAYVGNPNQIANKNIIIHSPEREAFPWQGSILAIYVIRFLGIVFGIGTILITASLGRTLFNSEVGLLAAGLTAFNPMYLFVTSAVNNDSLTIFLGHVGLYLLVLIWRNHLDPRRRWWYYALLGIVLGLGILTKLSLGALLGLTGIALAAMAWRNRNWRFIILGGGIVLFLAILISSPWFIRNMRLYGDPTALDVFISVQGIRSSPITLRDWISEFGTFYRSFWGLFGGVNVASPELIYHAYNLLAFIGIIGFFRWSWKQIKQPSLSSQAGNSKGDPSPFADEKISPDSKAAISSLNPHRGTWLLLTWAVLLFFLLIRWNIIAPSFQGRLIFPALGALNVLWAVGLLIWVNPKNRRRLAMGLVAAAFTVAMLLPWITIKPAYAFPEPLESVPQDVSFGPIIFRAGEDEIHLVGVEFPTEQSVAPGDDPIEVVMYWQAPKPVQQDYLSTIHLLGRKNTSVGFVNRYPGWGMIPTSLWQPGEVWRDVYNIYVNGDADSPSRLQVKASLYDSGRNQDLAAYGPDEEPIELLVIGEARLSGDKKDTSLADHNLEASFAEGVRLMGYSMDPLPALPGKSMELTLFWEAEQAVLNNYTVFVHLLDANGNQVANGDGPPVFGDYPTYLWREGDLILDEHTLVLPADLPHGEYEVTVGLYDPVSLTRLPREDGEADSVSWLLPVGVKR